MLMSPADFLGLSEAAETRIMSITAGAWRGGVVFPVSMSQQEKPLELSVRGWVGEFSHYKPLPGDTRLLGYF